MLYSRSRFSWELSEIGAAKLDGARLLRGAPAAFRRLCVETICEKLQDKGSTQPPSGGCVLKLPNHQIISKTAIPAAFRRLCVETWIDRQIQYWQQPAAFRRLCVETVISATACCVSPPAAFRRLCVETSNPLMRVISSMPAAFRRLCVETCSPATWRTSPKASRLQAAVC